LSWSPSPFKNFRLVEGSGALGNMRVWTITELLTSRALSLEGQAMRHCVATYADRCARRQTSIWSVQVEPAGSPQGLDDRGRPPHMGSLPGPEEV